MGNTFLPFSPQAKKTVEKGKNNRPPHCITHCIVGVWGIDWSRVISNVKKTPTKNIKMKAWKKIKFCAPLFTHETTILSARVIVRI
jgi:hypothetical protein